MIPNASYPAPDYDSSDQLWERMYDSDHHRRTTGETSRVTGHRYRSQRSAPPAFHGEPSLPGGRVNVRNPLFDGEPFDRALSAEYGRNRREATDDRMMAVSSRAGDQSYEPPSYNDALDMEKYELRSMFRN